jgi:hypothetical protein
MSNMIDDVISTPVAPVHLPQNIREGRDLIHWGTVFFIIAGVIWILWGVADILWSLAWSSFWWTSGLWVGTLVWGIIRIALGFVALLLRVKVKTDIIGAIDQGRYAEAADKSLLYAILGFIFAWVIGGILILLGQMKLKEAPVPGPGPMPAPGAPPPAPGMPPQPAPQPAPRYCQTCGRPGRYVAESQSHYCDVCQKYL